MDHKETMGFLIPTLAQLVERLTVEVIVVIKLSLVRFRQVGKREPRFPLDPSFFILKGRG